MDKKQSILVIGDAHAHPDYPNTRFDWLSKMILEVRPDVVMDMGDFADMPSLSSFDFGKTGYEGRRYKRDIACAINARTRVMASVVAYNKGKAKAKQYNPRWVALGGNHEEARINRVVENNALLQGVISYADLGYAELGWDYVPFGKEICVGGIYFSHYFVGGVRDKPVEGMYPAATLLKRYHTSRIMGHSHYFQVRHESAHKGHIWAFIAGCYFDYEPNWTKQAHNFYDRGILVLHGVANGDIDAFSWVGIDEIKRRYSK